MTFDEFCLLLGQKDVQLYQQAKEIAKLREELAKLKNVGSNSIPIL